MEDAYVGMIIGFAGNYAPYGWALCDGSLLPVSGNEALFSLIGTQYGGDGINNFGLPNLMQCVIVGGGQGTGLSNRIPGQTGGVTDVTLTVSNIPQHSHTFNVSNSIGAQSTPTSGCTLSAIDLTANTFYDSFVEATPPTLTALNPASTSTVGSGGSHTNVMPYQEINYIIHLTGMYPNFD
ncbi:MAG TPA: tail fiber protein [Mobilitalea sp.]|nr:tail fiber protein [Mobilitalea sp.]